MNRLFRLLVLAMLFFSISFTSQPTATIKPHVFKFYLDPALVPNMDFARAVLPKYVEDMNTILAKNTSRRLVFNPETDIILMYAEPQTNYSFPPLPVEGFEIWAHAIRTSYPLSYGGTASSDISGAGVLAGLKWTRLYDPDETMAPLELTDYWTQIHIMLHELGHVFGAGIGEYYALDNIQDTTGVIPILNINYLDPSDPFWSDKQDFIPDPLMKIGVKESRQARLDYVRFSALSATIIGGNYRNGTPTVDLQHITVTATVHDPNGLYPWSALPVANAYVKIWSVNAINNSSTLVTSGYTDRLGRFVFAWGGAGSPHSNTNSLRLIKIYKDGMNSVKYISIFDADIVKLIDGKNTLNIPMLLDASVMYLPLVNQ